MAAPSGKMTGITTQVTVDDNGGTGRDISNDITSIDVSTPRGVQDVTGLDKSAVERLLLLADGKVTINGVFNAAANKSHDVFKTVPSSSAVQRTVVIKYVGTATTPDIPTLTMEVIFDDYQIKRAQNGELTYTVTGQLSNGTAPAWSAT